MLQLRNFLRKISVEEGEAWVLFPIRSRLFFNTKYQKKRYISHEVCSIEGLLQ